MVHLSMLLAWGMAEQIWRYPAERNAKLVFYSTPAVTPDGLVIVGSAGTDHSLIALKPQRYQPGYQRPFRSLEIYRRQGSLGGCPAGR